MWTPAKKLSQVVLEILRYGPPNNQLLSKLTPYLTLCGNLGAETIYVPFDHLEYETRIDELSRDYLNRGDAEKAKLDVRLDELGRLLTEMLENIPGLAPSLASAQGDKADLTHLRLVLTPRELSLLPFECINVPRGAPGGSGNKLLLQTEAPVTLTRQVRGVNGTGIVWPAKPKILFAWAAPNDAGSVPWEEHALILRRAIEPWIDRRPHNGDGDQTEDERIMAQVKDLLTIIENATLETIRKACSEASYTHIHILAHGIPRQLFRDMREIGIALDDGSGRRDLVEGRRLATALNIRRGPEGTFPAVVSLATCDSGQARSVVSYGGSIAHELHVGGVPFVVASQFPLSKFGSIVMAQELYSRLLNAEDPRIAIYEARKRLFAHSNHYHDWAAVVAYASLPADFDLQTGRLQYEMTKRHIDRTLNKVDMLANFLVEQKVDNKRVEDLIDEIEVVLKQLELFIRRLCDHAGQNSRSIGLQASTEKRKADAFYSVAEAIRQSQQRFEKDKSDSRIKIYRRKALGSLLTAHGLYLKAITYQIDDWVDIYWVGVNYLSTALILKLNNEIRESVQYDHWVATKKACELDAIRVSSIPAWRHSSLAELFLIAAIVKNDARLRDVYDMSSWPLEKDQYIEYGRSHLDALCQAVDLASFEFYSTWRQFDRYLRWWKNELGESNYSIVKEFFQVLEKHRKTDRLD